jgi:hypothetical protein
MKQLKRPVSSCKARRPPLCDAGLGMATMDSANITSQGLATKHPRLASHRSILARRRLVARGGGKFGCVTGGLTASPCRLPSLARRTITWIADRRIGSRDGSDRRCGERWTDKTSRGVSLKRNKKTTQVESLFARALCNFPPSVPPWPGLPTAPAQAIERSTHPLLPFSFAAISPLLLPPSSHHLSTPSCSAVLLLFLARHATSALTSL